MNNARLVAHNIVKRYQQGDSQIEVLKGVSAEFDQGKTYAITGTSGAGKSTFLHIVGGLDAPTGGNVLFNGRDLAAMCADERSQFLNKSIGLVFQLPYLIDELSVVENVMIKGVIGGLPKQECKEKAYLLLKQVGLEAKASSKPSTLSGGQQQRVAIVRALFNEPVFLLADEPTGNLDEETGNGVVDFLADCRAHWHMGIIVSSHDEYVTAKMDHNLHLHNGLLASAR